MFNQLASKKFGQGDESNDVVSHEQDALRKISVSGPPMMAPSHIPGLDSNSNTHLITTMDGRAPPSLSKTAADKHDADISELKYQILGDRIGGGQDEFRPQDLERSQASFDLLVDSKGNADGVSVNIHEVGRINSQIPPPSIYDQNNNLDESSATMNQFQLQHNPHRMLHTR